MEKTGIKIPIAIIAPWDIPPSLLLLDVVSLAVLLLKTLGILALVVI
jgi:hypothetical protein